MAWALKRGPIPAGARLVRTCQTPRCIRPKHHTVDTTGRAARTKRPEPDEKPRLRRYRTAPKPCAWRRSEDLTLLEAVGGFTLRTVRKRTGRSADAIYARLRREHGGGGLSRGSFTLAGAIAETGYVRSQLFRARHALGQAWLRTSPAGRWLISVEQIEEIGAWLKNDYWCVRLRLTECLSCRRRDVGHFANGLCRPCYVRTGSVARSLGLRLAVGDLRKRVERLLPAAAPSDVVRLTEYRAQLGRRLALLEPEIRQLARIAHLHDLTRGR